MDEPTENSRSTAAPTPSAASVAPGENPGDTIGPYRLLEILGEGGFGTVYLAERREPFVQRVALKIIKPGMDSRAVIARFEQERQALAVMDHPNVAKVHDAGTTSTGRPYFVMEHVKGEPITNYCDRHRLTIRERLELFIPVCEAVQHAHMKGIIHRDIKPGNILVAVSGPASSPSPGTHPPRPIPKVIDFGVAKAVSHALTDKTIFTETGQLIGTPEYMSPEQAEMGSLDVDTRTDVYSLGVVLYELLTGLLPFDRAMLRAKGYDEIRRIIREVDPPTPSKRLSALANEPGASATARADQPPAAPGGSMVRPGGSSSQSIAVSRHTGLQDLSRLLRRELEWVPLKALRKDRAHRYSSPEALAADVRRFLDGRALEAGPESALYRARKFARRYRSALLAGAAVMLALAAGLATTLWQMREAVRSARAESEARREVEFQKTLVEAQRDQAEQARERAEAINEFVTRSLRSSDPNRGGAQAMTVADAMTQALADLDKGGLKDQPAIAAGLLRAISEILNGNSRSVEAEAPAERALKIERELHAGDHADVAASLSGLATVCQELGRATEAESLLQQALEMYQRLYKGDHKDVASGLSNLAYLRVQQGRVEEAEPLYVQALEMNRRLFKGDDQAVAGSLDSLGYVLQALGRPSEAEPLLVQALEMKQHLYQGDNPAVAVSMNGLAYVRHALGRASEAEPLYVQALEMRRRLFGGDHPQVADSLDNLALVRTALGRAAEAEPLHAQALEIRERLFKGDHSSTVASLNNLALVRRALGRMPEAEALFARALEMNQRLNKGDHPHVAMGLNNLASVRESLGRATEAEPLYVQALEMNRRLFAGDHPEVAKNLNNLASLRQSLGRAPEAEVLFGQALEMQQRLFKGDHPAVATTTRNLARCLAALDRLPEALARAQEAADMAARILPEGHPLRKRCDDTLAEIRKKIEGAPPPPGG